ncbi:MAG TPA: isochorismatase family cysteine hydrolase [Draconibacterium sp.]|nr:isochorismatase family cysteine hydrolase [Draconibacterium sp.]
MRNDILFWNVDTQIDFVEPEGKLYVPGAELLKPVWAKILSIAAENNIRVVNTADFHYTESAELSDQPDFITTFPEHCMANTKGAEYVSETEPISPFVVDWNNENLSLEGIMHSKNIVIRKDAFDVFAGNPYTEEIVKIINPKTVIVFGVTTNVCVNDAVVGLSQRVDRILVVEDAIKELPNIALPFEDWKKLGVEMISSSKLEELLD